MFPPDRCSRFGDVEPRAAARFVIADVLCARFHVAEPRAQDVSAFPELTFRLLPRRCTRFHAAEPRAQDLSALQDVVPQFLPSVWKLSQVLCEFPEHLSGLEDVLSALLDVLCARFDVVEPHAAVLALFAEDVFPLVGSTGERR
jgi:hypothetical protein